MPGASDLDQLSKIFQLCGTPDEHNWKGLADLPNIQNKTIMLPFPEIHQRQIRVKFHKTQYLGLN
jgi:hypothetical protein